MTQNCTVLYTKQKNKCKFTSCFVKFTYNSLLLHSLKFLIITVVIPINFEVLITEVMNISPLYTGKHVSLHLALPAPLRRCSE